MHPFLSDIPEKEWKIKDGYFYGHPTFAIVLSIPVLLSFVLLIPHWYITEKTPGRRWATLPLLLLQVWPQYRVLKLLIALFKDHEDQQKYHKKKEEHNQNITCLGKSKVFKIVTRAGLQSQRKRPESKVASFYFEAEKMRNNKKPFFDHF